MTAGYTHPWYGEIEVLDDSHYMLQAVRVGLTDHTGSIVSSMACMFDLKNRFLCNSNSSKSYSVGGATAMVW